MTAAHSLHHATERDRPRDLTFRFQTRRGALTLDVEARIPADGITVLRGDSGSGKTTIADLLAGRIRPEQGYAAVDDVVFTDTTKDIHLPVHARGIGYVFQTHRLLPHLTVRENLEFPVKVGGRHAARDRDESTDGSAARSLDAIAEALGIVPLLDRKPPSLSGGESQRVALGRALLGAERLLILDEPLSSLDPKLRGRLMDLISEVVAGLSVPVLYITHSDAETRRLAKRCFKLIDGELRRVAVDAAPDDDLT